MPSQRDTPIKNRLAALNKQGTRTIPEFEKRLRQACSSPLNELYEFSESRASGLTPDEAAEKLRAHGKNIVAASKKRRGIVTFALRFKDPLIAILAVISAFSFITGDNASGFIVLGIIVLSVFLAHFQESKSSRAAEKLKLMIQASAMVVREGKQAEIPVSDVVVGDVIVLAAGSIVPADMRIISAKDFYVTQSAFTGESLPVEKVGQVQDGNVGLFEIKSACFQGSTVVSGSARGVAVNTGMQSCLGSVAAQVMQAKGSTDFDKGIVSFVVLMIRLMLVIVVAIFLIQGIFKHNWLEAALFGLSVAVGLTPGMLPMIVTVCLSKGAVFMSRKQVIVKQLKSIQNLGSMDILCTDKTGTITQDRVVLEKHVDVTNRTSEDVLRYAWMNSYYQTGLRNLLDNSILSNEDLDVERSLRKVDEIPFDFNRKRMSVIVDYESDHVLICKGSVEAIFEACDRYQIDDEIFPLIDIVKHDILEEYTRLSSEGYRVLAIAYREFETKKEVFGAQDESGLIMLGYLAFFDPPKDSSEKAIQSLAALGVRVKILTGDNELVTAKVCQDVGLGEMTILTGSQLDALDAPGFIQAVETHDVFARLTPAHKQNIVNTLRAQGHVVGFMGDGINDAAAMRCADIGISVDTAVDVAKESADIILLEKSLLVLEKGIREGRSVFSNITKYICMGGSSSFGNMFSMVGASILLPFLPMAPVQILLNNLLYDASQIGIPLDNVDAENIRYPQKWNIGNVRTFILALGPVSSIFDYATFGLMWWFFGCSQWLTAGADARPAIEALFHTGWFVESIITQCLIIHIIRTRKLPFLQSRASMQMTVATIMVIGLAILLPYTPLAPLFGFVPLPPIFWMWMAGFMLAYMILATFVKGFVYNWQNRRAADKTPRKVGTRP